MKPIPAQTAAMIKKRSMILVSDQARSSKWWWTGAISRIRRLKALKAATWSATESALFARAGLHALVLVALSGLLTWLLTIRRLERLDT